MTGSSHAETKEHRSNQVRPNRPGDPQPSRRAQCHRRRAAGSACRLRGPSQFRSRRARHRAVGCRPGVLCRVRPDGIRPNGRRQRHHAGNALGPDEGLRLHDEEYRTVHEPVAIVSSGDLQGARICHRERLGHCSLRRHHRNGRRRRDRVICLLNKIPGDLSLSRRGRVHGSIDWHYLLLRCWSLPSRRSRIPGIRRLAAAT